MRIRLRHATVIGSASLVLLFASCDKSPTGPPSPGPPPPPAIVRIEIVGPSEIAPGESVQLTVNAIKTDGSAENVTAQSQWSPANTPVLQISATGLATGKINGEGFVNARLGNRNASKRIFVLPTGTFRLSGVVKESGFGIAGATVSVISGTENGLTATSGFGGFYALYGVSGVVRIQTRKDGYLNAIQQLDVTAHRTVDLEIVAERGRPDFRGAYTLTILAGGSCASSLPPDARRREYTATVAQQDARVTVTLADADFIVTNGRGRSFTGFIEVTNDIRFTLGDAFYYYYYYGGGFDIVERIGNFTLLISGTATTTATPGRIAGSLSGSLVTSTKAAAPFTPFSAQCHGSAHGFEMVRR